MLRKHENITVTRMNRKQKVVIKVVKDKTDEYEIYVNGEYFAFGHSKEAAYYLMEGAALAFDMEDYYVEIDDEDLFSKEGGEQ